MGRLGWTPDQTPLVLSGACTDFDAMARRRRPGRRASTSPAPRTASSTPLDGLEGASTSTTPRPTRPRALEYGMTEDDLFKGFATQGFSAMMNIWEIAQTIDGEVTGEAIADAFASTDGTTPAFGGSPLDCAGAPEPYVSVCARRCQRHSVGRRPARQVVDRAQRTRPRCRHRAAPGRLIVGWVDRLRSIHPPGRTTNTE